MEKNQPASQSPSLNANSKELRKALVHAAKQANKMADAFGLKVPSTQPSSTKPNKNK